MKVENLSLRELRERAETALGPRGGATASPRVTRAAMQEVMHELDVHMVELEMQNESLRAAQVELGRMRDRYRDLYDLAPVGYVTLDDTGRIRDVNRAASHLLGAEPARLMARPLVAFMCEADADRFQRHLGDARSSGRKRGCDVVLTADPARSISVHVDSVPVLDEAGEPVGFRSVMVDHSDLRQTEAQLRSSELQHDRDLEELRRTEDDLRQAHKLGTVGRLASGVAHDFNNVLAAIVGCINVAQAEETPPEQMAEHLARAIAVAQRGGQLSGRLLAFARGQPFQPAPVLVDDLVEDMALMLRRLVSEQVVLQIRTGAPGVHVLADHADLEQVLLNLAANARDAMPEGGTLTIRTDAVRSVAEPSEEGAEPPQRLRMVVEDTGVGMAESTRKRIFEPFFSTKEPGAGTGLGLATVRGVVDRLGGQIEVDSREGEGTRFTFSFPRCEAPTGPVVPDHGPVERSALPRLRGRALLVEDEPLVRMGLRHELERLGLEVVEARDVDDAIAIVQAGAERIDLLVSDVVMPGMSGPALAERLRRSRPRLPILFVTANPETLRTEALEGVEIVHKPYRTDVLARALVPLLPEPGEKPSGGWVGPTILVVEDEKESGDMLVKLLELEGHEAVRARDAEEALRIVRQRGGPGVLLTDVLLPGMRGDELAAELRLNWPNLPVVYMSGHPDVPRGATAFVAKPIDFDALAEVIAAIVDEE